MAAPAASVGKLATLCGVGGNRDLNCNLYPSRTTFKTHLSLVMVSQADQQLEMRPAIGEAATDTALATESPAFAIIDNASQEKTPCAKAETNDKGLSSPLSSFLVESFLSLPWNFFFLAEPPPELPPPLLPDFLEGELYLFVEDELYLLVENEGLVLDDPELSPGVDLTILAILALVLDSSFTSLSKSLWSNLSWTCLSVLLLLSLLAAFSAVLKDEVRYSSTLASRASLIARSV